MKIVAVTYNARKSAKGGEIYVLIYLLENVGKNETERIHPFNLWLGESWYTTPYFEMVFIMEVLRYNFLLTKTNIVDILF